MVTKEKAIARTRTTCLVVALLLIGVSLFFQWGCVTTRQPILPGQLLQQELTAKASHQYALTLNAGQYARILLTPTIGRIEGKLYDPRMQQLANISFFDNEQGELSIIATESGTFHLAMYSLEQPEGKASYYSLKWEELRTVVDQDKSRVAAEIVFAEAEKLRTEWKAGQTRKAIQKYSAAKDLWQGINEPRNVAKALRKIGTAFLSLGELSAARANYAQACMVGRENEDWEVVARTLNDWCDLDFRSDEPEEAYKKATEIFDIGQRKNKPQIIAMATAHLNQIESYSDPMKTIPSYEKLLQFWSASGERQQQADIHQKLGIAYYFAGEFKKAIEAYEQSFQLSQAVGDRYKEARALIYQGNAYSVIGEKQQALSCYKKARPLIEQIGDQMTQARLKTGLGFIFDSLGNQNQALTYRQESLQLFHLLEARGEEATTLMYVGELNNSLGNSQIALASFGQALQLFRELKDYRMEYHALRNIGRVFESQVNNDQALLKYNRALLMSRPGRDEIWKAYVHVDIGRLLQRNKQYTQASIHYRQALEFNRKTEDKIGESQTYYYMAKLSLALHHLPEAKAQIKQAASIIESVRAKVISQELRTSYFASVNQIFGLSIDILMQQHQQIPSGNFAQEALSASEQSRARSLLELLNESRYDIKQGVAPQVLEQEHSLLQTLKGKADRKMQLTGNKDKEAELAAVTKEVDDLSSQLDDVRSKIRETSPRYAALTQPQPLKAAEIQQLLDDDTMLLEYALGDERSYLWAVTNHSIDAYTLPNRATIEPLVREVYQLMTAPPPRDGETAAQWHQRNTQAQELYWLRATKLSQMVLGPVAEKLGNQRLIVVGDGALQLLPFAALPEPVVGGRRSVVGEKTNPSPATNYQPLIVNHEITNLPSASSLKLLREERGKPAPPNGWLARWTHSLRSWLGQENKQASLYSVAVLADPVFGKEDKRMRGKEPNAAPANQPQTRDVDLSDENVPLPRLIATREEAEEIQKVAGANAFLLKHGFDVNRGLLESEALNRYGVIHFATHGFWDSANPELSGIFLSRFDQQGKPHEGAQRLSDSYNLKLSKELFELSACETAVGKDIRGEGLIALTRGFMYAGAARVMASLWKVDDTATAEMMKIFYQHLLRDKTSPAAALRQAQITMWQKEPSNVPYNWAAFVLQGEYR